MKINLHWLTLRFVLPWPQEFLSRIKFQHILSTNLLNKEIPFPPVLSHFPIPLPMVPRVTFYMSQLNSPYSILNLFFRLSCLNSILSVVQAKKLVVILDSRTYLPYKIPQYILWALFSVSGITLSSLMSKAVFLTLCCKFITE